MVTPQQWRRPAEVSRRAWVTFGIVAILWGVPYLFIRIAVGEVSPVFVAWVRVVIAAGILLPLAASRSTLRNALAQWRWILLLAAFYMALAWTLIPLAETSLPSSLAAIIIAGVPIVTTVFNMRRERPGPMRIAGLVIGLLGVMALVGIDVGVHPSQLLAVGCLLVVLVCYAAGPVMTSRKLVGIDSVAVNGLAAGFAALILSPIVAFQLPSRVPSLAVILSLAVLGVFCSAVALVAFFIMIRDAGPARATVVIYVNPAVAVVAGVLVLHEHVSLASIIGLICILAGSWLATTGRIPLLRTRAAAGSSAG
jgi:drug/metabolite transporter (DMT)-like permease